MKAPESAFDSERTASKGCAFSLLDIVDAGLSKTPVIDDVSRHSILNDDPKNTLAKMKQKRTTPVVLFTLLFSNRRFFILVYICFYMFFCTISFVSSARWIPTKYSSFTMEVGPALRISSS